MFSGIIKEIGNIINIESQNGITTISVSSTLQNIKLGNSISINGCCLTVTDHTNNITKFEITQETLNKTSFKFLSVRSKVNLEKSLTLGESLDGHLVLGHVDTCGTVEEILIDRDNRIIKISFPEEYKKYIAEKGSICVNGVSLTVIDTKNGFFTFTLIPFTRDNTNLGLIKEKDLVNLEVDVISRYTVNYLENTKAKIKC